LDPLCIPLVVNICVLQPPIATSSEIAYASQVLSKGPIVRAYWCTLGDEPWVCPYVNNCPVMQAIDFWVNTTLEGYIIEFPTEKHQSFSYPEEIFKKDTRGRLLREIPLWIKVFLMEEGMLTMSPTEMAV
jgi:hypothetical protein